MARKWSEVRAEHLAEGRELEQNVALRPTATCAGCGHVHSPEGCTGPPTRSDLWAGVSPAACDCDCP